MPEYIEREAFLKRIKEESEKYDFDIWIAEDIAEKFPAADVEPVRHGKWKDGDSICPICGEDKFAGLDADIWSDWKPKRCPNCGAKMDLGGKQ